MLDDIAKEADVGVFYSFPGPFFLSFFIFLKSFHSHNDFQKQFQSLFWKKLRNRAVIKRRGPGISPGYYERLPRLLSKKNRAERNS